jgi:hypothetical protein
MKLEIGGDEKLEAPRAAVWSALNDPAVLETCIPGCRTMTETGPDEYSIDMQLRVASVGGGFGGAVALSDKVPPTNCRITVSGSGTLGHGTGTAAFELVEVTPETTRLVYSGSGEIGGLVAGVGQRILKGVAKHLTGRFFAALRKGLQADVAAAD